MRSLFELALVGLLGITFVSKIKQEMRADIFERKYLESAEMALAQRDFYATIYSKYADLERELSDQRIQIEIQTVALQKNYRAKYRRQVINLMGQVRKNRYINSEKNCDTIFSWIEMKSIISPLKKTSVKCSTSSWIASMVRASSSLTPIRTSQNL